jgi:hypothetical protein
MVELDEFVTKLKMLLDSIFGTDKYILALQEFSVKGYNRLFECHNIARVKLSDLEKQNNLDRHFPSFGRSVYSIYLILRKDLDTELAPEEEVEARFSPESRLHEVLKNS